MIEVGDRGPDGLPAGQRPGRTGLEVKLDRGFAAGTCGVIPENDDLAERVGITAARRAAGDYLALPREQFGRVPGWVREMDEDELRRGSRPSTASRSPSSSPRTSCATG
jgi:hypothetical protein